MVLEVIFGGFSGDLRSQTSFWMLGVAMVDYYDIYEKMSFSFFPTRKIFGITSLIYVETPLSDNMSLQ